MTGTDSSISNVSSDVKSDVSLLVIRDASGAMISDHRLSSDVCLLVIRDASGAMISDHRLSVSKWLPKMLNSFEYKMFRLSTLLR